MKIPKGVLTGTETKKLFDICKEHEIALPAVNVTGTNTINAALETAQKANSPIIIQLSNGGAAFMAGKGALSREMNETAGSVGAIAAAKHIHEVAKLYNVSIILHTDHAPRKYLQWVEALIEADKAFYAKTKRPLYSSHMLDLSEEPLEANLKTSKTYLKKLADIDMLLEVEIGPTGGEEDGIDNSHLEQNKLYSKPSEIYQTYKELIEYSDLFTIAAAFGNVHGVYRAGNVQLKPGLLLEAQNYIKAKENLTCNKPVDFVFHGGSGSTSGEIKEAISYGVVKMNIDTDLQWAFFKGVKDYYETNKPYLQWQVGNPGDANAPNKKYYDPRVWLRKGEENFILRLTEYFKQLNAINVNDKI